MVQIKFLILWNWENNTEWNNFYLKQTIFNGLLNAKYFYSRVDASFL